MQRQFRVEGSTLYMTFKGIDSPIFVMTDGNRGELVKLCRKFESVYRAGRRDVVNELKEHLDDIN